MPEAQGGSPETAPPQVRRTGSEPAPALTVVLVDDSAAQRRYLRAALEADGDVAVVGEAHNGSDAVTLVARLRPTAVLLDLNLPVMSGLEVIERIMATSPTPIVVWSAFVSGSDGANAAEALAAGAVDVVPKPGPDDPDLERYGDALRRRLRVAARVRVITHPRGRLREPGRTVQLIRQPHDRAPGTPARAPAAATPAKAPGAPATSTATPAAPYPPSARPLPPTSVTPSDVQLVVLGASTGGPQAVLTVLSGLPADLRPAVLVVQHMAAGFVPGLVAWLDDLLPFPVVVGVDGARLAPGTVTVAPSGGNLVLRDARLRVSCEPAPVGQHHVPGIDVTLQSVADVLGPRAVGVLLTGMGKDGAVGLLSMRRRGAATIAQDEATSAVYGMPAAAADLGAAGQQLPVDAIAGAVLAATGLTRA